MSETYLIEKGGRKRKNIILVQCAVCEKEIASRRDQVRKYCSKDCSTIGQRSRIIVQCGYCGRETEKALNKVSKSKSGLLFCNRRHKDLAQKIESGIKEIQPSHYGQGKGLYNYREKAIAHYGAKCAGCSYTELEGMLDVHHIDANRENNSLDNLIVLCIFCHTLITRGFAEITEDRGMQKT